MSKSLEKLKMLKSEMRVGNPVENLVGVLYVEIQPIYIVRILDTQFVPMNANRNTLA